MVTATQSQLSSICLPAASAVAAALFLHDTLAESYVFTWELRDELQLPQAAGSSSNSRMHDRAHHVHLELAVQSTTTMHFMIMQLPGHGMVE